MSAFFGAITSKIGGFFMSVALFLGASAPTVPPQSVSESVILESVEVTEEVVVTTKEDVAVATPSTEKTTPVAVSVIDSTPKDSEESQDLPLSITDLNVKVDGRTASFSWKTSVEARSSIVLDGETIDSVEGVSRTHTISVKDLTKGDKYPYEVTAKTLGSLPAEDKISRTLQMPTVYTISIKPQSDPGCSIFTVTNSEDNLVSGYSMVIAKGNLGQILMKEDFVTNAKGEIRHCKTLGNYFKIQGEDILKVVGKEGVSISNYVAENLTTNDLKEYGTFSVSFTLTSETYQQTNDL